MCKKLIFVCLTLAAVATIASAGNIRFTNASDSNAQYTGNTTLCSAPGVPWSATTVNSGTDGLWRKRMASNFGQPNVLGEGDVYEANGAWDANPEDVSTLVTTIAVPVELQGRTLNVYALIWSDSSQWRIRAAIEENGVCPEQPMPLFYANTLDWMTEMEPLGPNNGQAVLTTEAGTEFAAGAIVGTRLGGRYLYLCDLGTTVAGATISICVDSDNGIDRGTLASTWNARTWYDGVGYTPEPATVALLGLGGLALLRRRKHA